MAALYRSQALRRSKLMEPFMSKNKLRRVAFLALLSLAALMCAQCQFVSNQNQNFSAKNEAGSRAVANTNEAPDQNQKQQGMFGDNNVVIIAIAFGLLMLALHMVHLILQY